MVILINKYFDIFLRYKTTEQPSLKKVFHWDEYSKTVICNQYT